MWWWIQAKVLAEEAGESGKRLIPAWAAVAQRWQWMAATHKTGNNLCQKQKWRLFFHTVGFQRRKYSQIARDLWEGDHSGAMHAKVSYNSTYVYIQYNHIYMCLLDCDKVVFYSLLYRWCKL